MPEVADPAAFRWSERICWTLAGAALVNWSVQLLGTATTFEWTGVLLVLTGGWGLGVVLASWLPWQEFAGVRRWSGVLGWATAVLFVVTLTAWAYVQVRNSPGYGTDELAFDQYAAILARHGLNPYLHSLAPAFSVFQVSPDGYTYTLAGAPVTVLSYPALAFELYLPFVALGLSTQLGVILNVAAWGVSVLLMFALLPRRLRAAALVVGAVGVYVSYAFGGVTDVLYIPLLIGAAYRWDRFGAGRATYLGPVLLGLAMAIKQTPWMILPFVLCALAADTYATHGVRAAATRAGRYLAIATAAFLVPNIPYLVAAPGAWWRGSVTPITGHLVPAGQGVVALSLFAKVGGGALAAYTFATVLLAVVLVILCVGTYPLLRPLVFALPAVVLFVASRSYGNYVAALLPAALVGAVTTRQPDVAGWRAEVGAPMRLFLSRRWAVAAGAFGGLFAAALIYALVVPPPVSVQIAGLRTTGQLATVEQLTLRVENRSSGPVRPAFTVDEGGALTTFWLVSSGPRSLAAHTTAAYTIRAPNYQAQPSIQGGFSVLALTARPATVSSTGPYDPGSLHVALTPDAVNRVVPSGTPVVVQARLLDALDRAVARAGIAVSLGQIIYDQSGLELSEAIINGSQPGATPVIAHTNAEGVATFRIVGTQGGPDPVYFEANLVNATAFYPYGYSAILPIRFGG